MSDFSCFSEKVTNFSECIFQIVGNYLKIIRLELEIKKLNFDISQKYKKIGDTVYNSYNDTSESIDFENIDIIENINSISTMNKTILEKKEKIKNLKSSIKDMKEENNENDFEGEI